jgi:hypothetical protein
MRYKDHQPCGAFFFFLAVLAVYSLIFNQLYPVTPSFGSPPYFSVERAAAPYFGIKVCASYFFASFFFLFVRIN